MYSKVIIGGIGGSSKESIQEAKKIMEELNTTATNKKIDEDGCEVYEPEPHPEKVMSEIRYKTYQKNYRTMSARLTDERNRKINKSKKAKNKRNMIKKSKRINRR